MNVNPGATFEAVAHFPTGLTGVLGVRIRDNQGADALARTTAGVAEDIAGSGIYTVTLIAPDPLGQYSIVWDDADGHFAADELVVTGAIQDTVIPQAPNAGDLCTLDDVLSYVPSYVSNAVTNATLQRLITSESQLFASQANREIARQNPDPSTRLFTVDRIGEKASIVRIGDLTSADTATLTLLKSDGTADVDITDLYVPLYDGARNATMPWQPVTEFAFPRHLTDAPKIRAGKVLQVAGVWGFPAIPAFVREGVAARVIIRYLVDVAAQGTDFADAIQLSTLNFAGLFQRSEDALQELERKPWP